MLELTRQKRQEVLEVGNIHNTAPAIALAARFCKDELGADTEEVLFVTPADHIIQPLMCS